jgi:hypothetical protein
MRYIQFCLDCGVHNAKPSIRTESRHWTHYEMRYVTGFDHWFSDSSDLYPEVKPMFYAPDTDDPGWLQLPPNYLMM